MVALARLGELRSSFSTTGLSRSWAVCCAGVYGVIGTPCNTAVGADVTVRWVAGTPATHPESMWTFPKARSILSNLTLCRSGDDEP